eukprot:6463293-Amphidinium_carterae.1
MDVKSLVVRILCCKKACSRSTARPQPDMPQDASTGSESAPFTRMHLLPRCISMARLRAAKGKPACPADASSKQSWKTAAKCVSLAVAVSASVARAKASSRAPEPYRLAFLVLGRGI